MMAGKYKAYSEYKDSGIEWLGDIPSQWKLCRLKFMAKIKNGQDYKNVEVEEGFPVIGSGGQFTYASKFTYDQESVLLGRKGTIDKPLYINEPFWTVDTMYYTEIHKDVYPKYLYYLALTIQFGMYSTNTALPSMTQENLGNYTFTIPDDVLEEKTIANFLDYETAKIDMLIDKQQKLIKLLKEKRHAVISHAVTKGLNPNVTMRDSGVEWLGAVPEHWAIYKLKHIISSLDSGVSVNAVDNPAQGNELGVLKTSCVYTRSFRIEENKTVLKEEEGRVKCPIRKGAIIISRMNTPELVGASALVEVDDSNIFLPDRLWQTVFSNKIKHNPKFIAFFMMIKGFRKQISLAAEGTSSSMQNIAQDDYLSINITIPDVDEQDTIVCHLENKLGALQNLEERVNKIIKLMQERRVALIFAAVTGKIDVGNWQLSKSFQNNKKINEEHIT